MRSRDYVRYGGKVLAQLWKILDAKTISDAATLLKDHLSWRPDLFRDTTVWDMFKARCMTIVDRAGSLGDGTSLKRMKVSDVGNKSHA